MKKLMLWTLVFAAIVAAAFFLLRMAADWNGDMQHPRSEIHAAALDGRIYVAGGIGLFRVLDSCEVYIVANSKWEACGRLPRALHHVAMASDGKRVYASGGYVALPFEQDKEAALFAYEPAENTWTEIARLPHPIGQHAMVHHKDALYLVGGQNGAADLATLWRYDLKTAKWSELQSMPKARHSHAVAVDGDHLFVTGGRSAALGTEIDIVEVYDFAKDSWHRLSTMPVGRGGHGAFVRRQKLHIIGGESLTKGAVIRRHDIFDLKTQKWSKADPLASGRHGHAVVMEPRSGEVFAIGGGAHPSLRTIYSVTGTVQSVDFR